MTQAPRDADQAGEQSIGRQTISKPRLRPAMLAVAFLLLIVTRYWLFAFIPEQGDMLVYDAYSRMGVDEGLVAYRDFKIEYPPLAWWFMAAPRAIARATHPTPELPKESVLGFIDYIHLYRVQCLAIDVLCFMLLLGIGGRISPRAEIGLPVAHALIGVCLPHLIYTRLDVVLLALCLGSTYCWLRSLEATAEGSRWAAASYFCLGLGVSFKIIPILFFPFFILADWRSIRRSEVLCRALMFAAGAAGPFLIQACFSGPGVLRMFQYHGEREVLIDSTAGSLMLIAHWFGVPCKSHFSHWSFVLLGPLGSPLKALMIVLATGSGLALGLWALLLGRRFDRALALDFAIVTTVNSFIFSTVFSPQYVIWLMPLALITAARIVPPRPVRWCLLLACVAATALISGWLYPNHGNELINLVALPVSLSVIRSACLITIGLLLTFCLVQKVQTQETAAA